MRSAWSTRTGCTQTAAELGWKTFNTVESDRRRTAGRPDDERRFGGKEGRIGLRIKVDHSAPPPSDPSPFHPQPGPGPCSKVLLLFPLFGSLSDLPKLDILVTRASTTFPMTEGEASLSLAGTRPLPLCLSGPFSDIIHYTHGDRCPQC